MMIPTITGPNRRQSQCLVELEFIRTYHLQYAFAMHWSQPEKVFLTPEISLPMSRCQCSVAML